MNRRVILVPLFGASLLTLAACGAASTPVFQLSPTPNSSNSQSVATPAVQTPQAPSVPADARAVLFGNASPPLASGHPGVIDIVAQGAYDGSSVPIVLRNNTSGTVHGIEVTGEARDASSHLIGTGSSQDIYPNNVAPGQIAVGYVYFSGATLPAGTTFSFQSDGKLGADTPPFAKLDLSIGEASITADGSMVGTVKNPLAQRASGPIGVMAMCFDQAGHVLGETNGFADGHTVDPGGTDPFTLRLGATSCPVYLVGAEGFGF